MIHCSPKVFAVSQNNLLFVRITCRFSKSRIVCINYLRFVNVIYCLSKLLNTSQEIMYIIVTFCQNYFQYVKINYCFHNYLLFAKTTYCLYDNSLFAVFTGHYSLQH